MEVIKSILINSWNSLQARYRFLRKNTFRPLVVGLLLVLLLLTQMLASPPQRAEAIGPGSPLYKLIQVVDGGGSKMWYVVPPGATSVDAAIVSGVGLVPVAILTTYLYLSTDAAIQLAQNMWLYYTYTVVPNLLGEGGAATGLGVGSVVAIGAGVVFVAIAGTIAIDCWQNNGECIWTTIQNAGGIYQVLGIGPDPTAAPIIDVVTVSCASPIPVVTQCKDSSLRNVITQYYSWFGGSYWTCGDIWNYNASHTPDFWFYGNLATCNDAVAMCVQNSMCCSPDGTLCDMFFSNPSNIQCISCCNLPPCAAMDCQPGTCCGSTISNQCATSSSSSGSSSSSSSSSSGSSSSSSSSSSSGSSSSSSANSPGTVVNDTSIGTVAWTTPSNATASDSSYATVSLTAQTNNYLKATNFGFNIPTGSTINGITVEFQKKTDNAWAYGLDNAVRIVKGGTIGTTDKSNASQWPITESYVSYGSSTDLWGTTWTAEDINLSTFGVALSSKQNNAEELTTHSVNHIRITVNYTP